MMLSPTDPTNFATIFLTLDGLATGLPIRGQFKSLLKTAPARTVHKTVEGVCVQEFEQGKLGVTLRFTAPWISGVLWELLLAQYETPALTFAVRTVLEPGAIERTFSVCQWVSLDYDTDARGGANGYVKDVEITLVSKSAS